MKTIFLRHLLLSGLVVLLCQHCKARSATSGVKVEGGSFVTDPSDPIYLSTVSILNASGQSFCTGTYVAEKIVATAAHCVESGVNTVSERSAMVGFGQGPKFEQVIKVVESRFPTSYQLTKLQDQAISQWFAQNPLKAARLGILNRGDQNSAEATRLINEATSYQSDFLRRAQVKISDIAILFLQDVPQAPFHEVDDFDAGQSLPQPNSIVLAGYGLVSQTDAAAYHGVLKKATLATINELRQSGEFEVTAAAGSGPCQGDSGGGIYAQVNGGIQLLGILSRSSNGGSCKDATHFYSDVRQNLMWLACQVPLGQTRPAQCPGNDAVIIGANTDAVVPSNSLWQASDKACVSSIDELLSNFAIRNWSAGQVKTAGDELFVASIAARKAKYGLCPN